MNPSDDVITDIGSAWHRFQPNKPLSQPAPDVKAKSTPKRKGAGASLGGIDVPKDVDFSRWYQQVLLKGEMIDYYDISGCYILRPGSWEIWEILKEWFNRQIKQMGVRNCSFPLFVTEEMLNREQNHIDGFSAEVAWVTQSGKANLDKRIAIRPTSETIIYPYLANWIRSYRELPLRLNQWNSVVRWEFKSPQPFLRSREFYWQEGHTAHLTTESADEEVHQVLDLYVRMYRDFLALPVVTGRKTEKEKFAGADYTTTVEAYVPTTGRAIQGATSHGLGQNFSKMFDISVEDPNPDGSMDANGKIFVWQNSWAYSTRVLGVMVMVHGDDKGLVIPPRVAPTQVIIVPVGLTSSSTEKSKQEVLTAVNSVLQALDGFGIRVAMDIRDEYSPGWKFNHWELRGVPVRLELGPRELQDGFLTTSRRDTGEKSRIALSNPTAEVLALLDTIQSDMYTSALQKFRTNVKIITDWSSFTPAINQKHLCLIPFCLKDTCEDRIKKMSERAADGRPQEEDERAPSMGAKSLCIPFKQPTELKGTNTKCVTEGCLEEAQGWCLFGRSY